MITRIKDYNLAYYRRTFMYFWLNVDNSKIIHEESTQSGYNSIHASVDIMFILDLIKSNVTDSGDNIVILVSYNAQYIMMNAAITLARQNQSGLPLKDLAIAKIDDYQSNERKIMICDLVITQEIGFVRELNRLNVLLSRSQVGLYVVGNDGEMNKNKICFTKYLKPLGNHFREYRLQGKVENLEISSYVVTAEAYIDSGAEWDHEEQSDNALVQRESDGPKKNNTTEQPDNTLIKKENDG